MATRIQVRRGSTADWASANPILAVGEIAYNTTLDQVKIGDGTTNFASLEYFPTLSDTQTFTNKTLTTPIITGDGVVFEGATNDAFETTLSVTDPTSDRSIVLPNVSGNVITTGNLSEITSTGTLTSLTISGNLTVNGTTTTINSTTLSVDDKNIELGSVDTPTNTTADGGGLTLKGTTDKTFNWLNASSAWTSSEHIALAAGKTLIFEGTTDDAFEATLTVADPTADRILTLPDATTNLVGDDTTQTLTNKTLTSPIIDGDGVVFEGATNNAFETTLTVVDPTSDRTITLPNLSGTVMINSDFTAKGHILVGTGAGTFVSLAPGNAGQNLIIDSGEPSGMRWATSSSGGAAFSEFMLAGA
ncbi:MAG: hypothetical protein EB127_02605 [Alphaproteobacteria bacterium]|nr:hypothetical protein [Alphaproteobacteria bacterium]